MQANTSRTSGKTDAQPTDKSNVYNDILETLDPDADKQRFYTCNGCGWPCINPVGTLPEKRELCLDCYVEKHTQSTLGDWSC